MNIERRLPRKGNSRSRHLKSELDPSKTLNRPVIIGICNLQFILKGQIVLLNWSTIKISIAILEKLNEWKLQPGFGIGMKISIGECKGRVKASIPKGTECQSIHKQEPSMTG